MHNPISLRVWYPRLVEDDSFARLLEALKYIGADRVYLFDVGYMDNYQLSPETLAERLPVLKKRIATLTEEGIVAGINSGATIGHGANMRGAERLMDLDWWTGADGKSLVGVACPLGKTKPKLALNGTLNGTPQAKRPISEVFHNRDQPF